jgi:hypothetical protein
LKKNLGPKITKDPTRKTACQLHPKTLSSSKMKQQAVSSFLKNALSNYLEVESPDDQVYFRQNKGIKQSKNKKEKQKSRLLS